MLPFDTFNQAMPYDAFLAKYGTPADRPRWDQTRAAVTLSDEQRTLLAKFTRRTNVLVLAGAWCGDCANQCPIFERFAEVAPVLAVRYLDRDAFPDAQRELQINGGNRVPVVVFFSEDSFEVARFGERTLTTYRRLAGVASSSEPQLASVVADWLREFERVQYVLKLSPRLRRLHGD